MARISWEGPAVFPAGSAILSTLTTRIGVNPINTEAMSPAKEPLLLAPLNVMDPISKVVSQASVATRVIVFTPTPISGEISMDPRHSPWAPPPVSPVMGPI